MTEADRIKKQIIDSFEDDPTPVIDALIEFLQSIRMGDNEEIAEECLYPLIELSIAYPYSARHDPLHRIIRGAIEWQAEQIAAEEEKLTRPTP